MTPYLEIQQTNQLFHKNQLYWRLWSLLTLRWILIPLRVLWITLNNIYSIPAYFLWLAIFSPVLLVNPALYWRIEEVFFGWMLAQVACWNYTAGYQIHESGDRLEHYMDKTLLVMPNHQSTADVPLCMTMFSARPRGADRVMWIMDKIFKFTNFGCVSAMHDDFFILAGKANRDESLIRLRAHLTSVFIPKKRRYIVLFPEGGFLRKRKPISQKFAKQNDLPMLEYCTLPRTGALEVIMDVVGPNAPVCNGRNGATPPPCRIDKVVDVTIAYPQGNPLDLGSILTAWREPCVTHFHYRVFDINEIPTDTEEMKQWMYNLYVEKEEMLKTYYDTGVFPHKMYASKSCPPKELLHDPMRFLIIHVFMLLSFAVFCTIVSRAYTLVFPATVA